MLTVYNYLVSKRRRVLLNLSKRNIDVRKCEKEGIILNCMLRRGKKQRDTLD
jgi:hypothetical protein